MIPVASRFHQALLRRKTQYVDGSPHPRRLRRASLPFQQSGWRILLSVEHSFRVESGGECRSSDAPAASPESAADGHLADLYSGNPDANRYALTVFAADPDTGIELKIVPNGRDVLERLRTVATQSRALDRRCHFAIFDQVSLRS